MTPSIALRNDHETLLRWLELTREYLVSRPEVARSLFCTVADQLCHRLRVESRVLERLCRERPELAWLWGSQRYLMELLRDTEARWDLPRGEGRLERLVDACEAHFQAQEPLYAYLDELEFVHRLLS